MSGSLTLREVRPADLDSVCAIEREVFTTDAWSREMVREEITADHRVYLALVDDHDEVHGYGGVLIVGPECDVQTIAIEASSRGNGYGRTMMNALLDAAVQRGALFCFLEVRADNEPARSLYASLGFNEVGVRPGYYQPDNVDAVVMRLEMGER